MTEKVANEAGDLVDKELTNKAREIARKLIAQFEDLVKNGEIKSYALVVVGVDKGIFRACGDEADLKDPLRQAKLTTDLVGAVDLLHSHVKEVWEKSRSDKLTFNALE